MSQYPRSKIPLSRRIFNFFWPERGWRRLLSYYGHRLSRFSGSPHKVALGFAIGMSQSCSPLVGIHAPMAVGIAWTLGGNMIAAGLGSLVLGNPVIMPFMLGLSFYIGRHLTNLGHHTGVSMDHLGWADLIHKPLDILLPLTVGWLLLGMLLGLASYGPVKYLVTEMRAHRAARLAERREARAHAEALIIAAKENVLTAKESAVS